MITCYGPSSLKTAFSNIGYSCHNIDSITAFYTGRYQCCGVAKTAIEAVMILVIRYPRLRHELCVLCAVCPSGRDTTWTLQARLFVRLLWAEAIPEAQPRQIRPVGRRVCAERVRDEQLPSLRGGLFACANRRQLHDR